MGQEQGHKGIREAEGKPINTAQILTGGGTSSHRIGYIDALKGFGILCVVIGHVTGTYMESNVFTYMNHLFHLIY